MASKFMLQKYGTWGTLAEPQYSTSMYSEDTAEIQEQVPILQYTGFLIYSVSVSM